MSVSQISRSRPHLRLTGTVAVLAALPSAVVALMIWVVAVPLAGIDLVVDSGGGPREVGPGAVVVAAAVATWAAYGVRSLVLRTRLPGRTWRVLVLTVLAVSLLGPAGAEDAEAFVALAAMHLGVAGVVLGIEVASSGRVDRR